MTTQTVTASQLQENRLAEESRNWWSITAASLLGGTVAVIAAPTIAVLAPVGFTGFLLSSAATGVIGSVTTKIVGNGLGANAVRLTYSPYEAQQRFRAAIIRHFDVYLETILLCVQTNTVGHLRRRTYLELEDGFSFLNSLASGTGRIYLDYKFEVVPRAGAQPRDLEQGVPPIDLSQHHATATEEFVFGTDSIFDGVGWATFEGVAFGTVGSIIGSASPVLSKLHNVPIVPERVGILVGMQSATGAVGPAMKLAIPPAQVVRSSHFIELCAEIGEHVNRIANCAVRNGVGLKYCVIFGMEHNTEGTAPVGSASGYQRDTVYQSWEDTIGIVEIPQSPRGITEY
jgi:hypothetical protein